jgi:hypothetical protein
MQLRWLALAALILLVALGVWWFAGLEPSSARAPLPTPNAESGATLPDPSALEAGSANAREETKLPAAPSAAAPAPKDAQHPSATIRAHCIDERGLPIGGVALQMDGGPALARSGADGRAEGPLRLWSADGGEYWIALSESFHVKQGFSRVLLPDVVCDLGDVVMPPAGRILGRVFDGRGRPVAKASACSSHSAFAEWASSQEPDSVCAATAEDGSFVLEGVPLGTMRVTARAQGYAPAERAPLEVFAGQELHGVEIALTEHKAEDHAGFVVHVLTPAGEPFPTAELVYSIREVGGGSSGNARVDAHGVRKLFCGPEGHVSARAFDLSGRYAAACAFDVPGSRGSLELRLGETTLHTLVVTDEQQKPVERYAFRTLQESEWRPLPGGSPTDEHGLLRCALSGNSSSGSLEATDEQRKPHPVGRAELRVPPLKFVIQVDAREFALAQLGPLAPETAPPEIHVTLKRLPGIRGIVTVDGQPFAGAWVKLFAATSRTRETFVNDLPSRVTAAPLLTTSSGSDGSFVLELRDAGDYEVQAGAPERGIAEYGPVHLVPNTGAKDLVLELPGLGAIEGRVLANAGVKLRDLVVGAARGDGRPFSVRTDAEGNFRFERLSPGRWLLRIQREDIDPNGVSSELRDKPESDEAFPSSCEVRAGETTRADIDLRQFAELVASVQVPGWEKAHWHAGLEPAGATQCRAANTDDVDGEHIRVRVDQPGEFLFRLYGQVPGTKHTLYFEERVHLEAGENAWKFAAEAGQLVLTNRKDEQVYAYVRCRLAGGRDLSIGAQIPARGELTLGGIPVGNWTRVDWKDGMPVEQGTAAVTVAAPGRLEWN